MGISGRVFLRRMTAAGIGVASTALFPNRATASRKARDDARAFLREHFVADLHAHPSLKTYFFRKHIDFPHPAPAGTWPFTLRVDGPSLRRGGVDAVVSAIYVPEPEFLDDCAPLKFVANFQPSLHRLKKSLRDPPDRTAFAIMDHFERELAREDVGQFARLARSLYELDRIRREGKTAILHAIEGGHALNGKIENVDAFHARGVCMITLAHFYDVGVTGNTMGIPYRKSYRALRCFRDQYASEHSSTGLHPFGRDALERMIELGMLVDLTHCTPEARNDIYLQAGSRTPLVLSHVGLHELAPYRINPTLDEVKRIADTGGVVGVIFLPFFLAGRHRGKGIDAIVETMARMLNAGGDECLGWGSDFDGFTNPPNDLTEPSDLPRLVDRMLRRFKPRIVEKILGGNVRRVLETGWRPPT